MPAIVVTYNLFMNGVDRMDPLRSTKSDPTKRETAVNKYPYMCD